MYSHIPLCYGSIEKSDMYPMYLIEYISCVGLKSLIIFSRLTAGLLKRDENLNSKQEIWNKRMCCGYGVFFMDLR